MIVGTRSRWSVLTAFVIAVLLCVGCGSNPGILGGKTLIIGIKIDQPDLGYQEADGSYTGFDIDVAKYVAQSLGYSAQEIVWVPVTSADREQYLDENKVQLVVASYTISQPRMVINGAHIIFAGPYLIAHQDVLVRADNRSIRSVSDLRNSTVCSTNGSTSAERLTVDFGQQWATTNLELETSFSDCVELLREGRVDAVSTDNAILIGYAQQDTGPPLRVLGLDFSNEPYGIGLSSANENACPRINSILRTMIQSGAWLKFLRIDFGPAAPEFAEAPEQDNCP
jgi:glutamate transport system substrate-binding protein